MRPKIYIGMIILTLIGGMNVWAEIIAVNTIEEAKPYFEGAGEDTLFAFDMDNTLVTPKNPDFRMGAYGYMPALHAYKHTLPDKLLGQFIAYFLLAFPEIPVQKDFPTVVNKLMEEGHKVIVLTASPSTELLNMGPISHLRRNALKNAGYDITKLFKADEKIIFESLSARHGRHPEFYKGIFLTDGKKYKAAALHGFLEKAEFSPKKIIFMDDEMGNVQEINEFMATMLPEVEFLGIHYTQIPDAIKSHGITAEKEAAIIKEWKVLWGDFKSKHKACCEGPKSGA